MHADKVILMIVLCAAVVCCNDSRMLTRNPRTVGSLFAWPQTFFRNRAGSWSAVPKLSQVNIRQWTRDGVANLLRFAYLASSGEAPMRIEFGPEDGPRAAPAYQRRYGYRGERLIEQLGSGFDPDLGRAAPSIFLTPPPPAFRR